jgi:hypothetical protein
MESLGVDIEINTSGAHHNVEDGRWEALRISVPLWAKGDQRWYEDPIRLNI